MIEIAANPKTELLAQTRRDAMSDQQNNAMDFRILPSMAEEALYELLDDPDAKVRHEAVKTLGKIGDAQSYRKLIAALKDHDKNVRKTAAWALGQIGERGSMVSELKPEQYLQQRVMKKIKIYGDLSEGQERYYKITSMTAIILSVLVPVLVNLPADPIPRILATIFSAMVTILVSAEKLYLFREHWRNYDLAEEELNRERYLYQTRSGDYAGKFDKNGKFIKLDDEEAYKLFASRCETIIQGEREKTIEARTKEGAQVEG